MNSGKSPKRYNRKSIAEELTGHIVDRKLPIGKRLDSTSELALRYGVSEKTIHRVLASLADRGLIKRIPGSGTYVSSNVHFSEQLRIGIFFFTYSREMPELSDLAFDRMNQQVVRELEAEGHAVEVIYHPSVSDTAAQTELLYAVNKFDIVIMASGFLKFAEAVIRKCNAKVVLILDDEIHPGKWHQIVFDYRPGFEKALRYLLARKSYRVFVAGLAGLETSLHRFEALQDAARQVGFPVENLHLSLGEPHCLGMPIYGGRDCAQQYLQRFSNFPPIISLSDFLTIGMVDVFLERGVPLEQLTIISYDNIIAQLSNGRKYDRFHAITHPLDQLPTQVLRMVEDITRVNEDVYKVRVIPALEFVTRNAEEPLSSCRSAK